MVEHRIFLRVSKKTHELALTLRACSPVEVSLWAEKLKQSTRLLGQGGERRHLRLLSQVDGFATQQRLPLAAIFTCKYL